MKGKYQAPLGTNAEILEDIDELLAKAIKTAAPLFDADTPSGDIKTFLGERLAAVESRA